MAETHCRHFSGYKPCSLNSSCDLDCKHRDVPQNRILIIHLGALGAVLRATSLLPALKRKYKSSHITWVTQAPADKLLENNPQVDRILTLNSETQLILSSMSFDIVICNDKSMLATSLAAQIKSGLQLGFRLDSRSGSILPANKEAMELWQLGLSDHQKFFVNKKPETQLLCESLNLEYKKDEYQLQLTAEERALSERRYQHWSFAGEQTVIGINTGCAQVIPYKKLTVEGHRQLIEKIQSRFENVQIVLLGGKEDRERNLKIASGLDVILSPTNQGLRDGLCSVNACDMVITGDSLGMHMAIALKKWVMAWFGPTCAHEIELYERGAKLLTEVNCAPCWKRKCSKSQMCYDKVDFQKFIDAIDKGLKWKNKRSSYKQPSLETRSFVSL